MIKYVADSVESRIASLDANDLLYQVNARATMTHLRIWMRSANARDGSIPPDDFINPPRKLGIAEMESKRLRKGTFVLLPISDKTHGLGTHTWAVTWKEYL